MLHTRERSYSAFTFVLKIFQNNMSGTEFLLLLYNFIVHTVLLTKL